MWELSESNDIRTVCYLTFLAC